MARVGELRDRLGLLADRLAQVEPLGDPERRALCGLWREVTEHKARSALPAVRLAGFVVDGWACREHQSAAGRRQIIQLMSPGDCHRQRRGGSVVTACLTHV